MKVAAGRRPLSHDEFLDHFPNLRQVGPDRFRAECLNHASKSKASVNIRLKTDRRRGEAARAGGRDRGEDAASGKR